MKVPNVFGNKNEIILKYYSTIIALQYFKMTNTSVQLKKKPKA